MSSRTISILITIFIGSLFFETSFAHNWMAPEQEAKKSNPIPFTQESVEKGKDIYSAQCSFCHGEKPTGLPKQETGLSMDTPNLVDRLKNHTEGDFHWKITNGRNGMPSFSEELSDAEIWHVINYIKSLNK